jgi:hypothetical protein
LFKPKHVAYFTLYCGLCMTVQKKYISEISSFTLSIWLIWNIILRYMLNLTSEWFYQHDSSNLNSYYIICKLKTFVLIHSSIYSYLYPVVECSLEILLCLFLSAYRATLLTICSYQRKQTCSSTEINIFTRSGMLSTEYYRFWWGLYLGSGNRLSWMQYCIFMSHKWYVISESAYLQSAAQEGFCSMESDIHSYIVNVWLCPVEWVLSIYQQKINSGMPT